MAEIKKDNNSDVNSSSTFAGSLVTPTPGPASVIIDYLSQFPNFLALFLVPITFLSIGPVLIEIGKELGTAPGNINLIFTFATAGMVAGQLTSTLYNRRIKRSVIILCAYGMLVAINIVLFFAQHIAFYFVLSILGGYLIGINYVQSTENILSCRIKNKDRLFILMISFYPMGALVAPLISSSLVNNNISWRYTYLIIAAAILITALLYALISMRGQNRIVAAEIKKVFFKEIFVDRQTNYIFIVTLAIVAIYIVAETIFATWTPTYLRLAKGFDIKSAALGVTVLQSFVIVGRFVSSLIAGKVKVKTILITISGLAFLSMILFVLSDSRFMLYAALGLTGLGFSAMYPLLVSSGSKVYPKGQGLLASLLYASCYFGRSFAPFITRSISKFSLDFSMLVSLIFSGISSALIIYLIINEKLKSGEAASTKAL